MQRMRSRNTMHRNVLEYPVRVRTADAQPLGGGARNKHMSWLVAILGSSAAMLAAIGVGWVLWQLGIRDGFILTSLALLIGGLPVGLLEWKEMRSGRLSFRRKSRGKGKLPEAEHPAE
jgi:hypothetical protein